MDRENEKYYEQIISTQDAYNRGEATFEEISKFPEMDIQKARIFVRNKLLKSYLDLEVTDFNL